MSMFSWHLFVGGLLLACGLGLSPIAAEAQSVQSRPSSSTHNGQTAPSRTSPTGDLPGWAEPDADAPAPASAAQPDDRLSEQPTTRNNPGFPDDPSGPEVPLGGTGGAVLLAAAGAAYGVRRLRTPADPNRPPPSD